MSNKMLRGNEKKTKSVRRFAGIIAIAVGFALVLSFVSAFSLRDSKTAQSQPVVSQGTTVDGGCDGLMASGECYSLEKADTNHKRIKGLSDRDSLAEGTGMLFTFDTPDEACIWMKDMRFNLDIVWFNSDKTITRIEDNVSPDTYPKTFCSNDTKYVIELNAGDATKLELDTGAKLQF